MGVIDQEQTGETGSGAAGAAVARRPVTGLVPLVVALVAVLGAVLLLLAPVQMSVPTATWPQEPTRPASTMLELTNQTPQAIDARFSCRAVRAAAGAEGGVVLSTLVPDQPAAAGEGLLVTTRDGRLTVVLRGQTLLDEPIGSGNCSYRLTGTPDAVVLERDGSPVGAARGDRVLPDVDVLATSVAQLPSDDDLRVTLQVDNQFNTTPTVAKLVLTAVVVLAALASLVLLRRADRRTARPADPGTRARGGLPAVVVDVLVVGAMVLWLFIAPASDDDGYYAAMARNAAAEGFVGNYYQLFNQSFTPFTWFYRLLGWWQPAGDSPVVLRIPALVAGLVTWLLLRRYVAAPGALPAAVRERRWGPATAALLLAAAFLAWWLPYGMGVRPEAAVGLLALASLAGVVTGLRTRRLFPVALGLTAAALSATCHPTGLVALAPFLVALPRLVPLVGDGVSRLGALTRTALVVAPGALGSVVAFADGTLHDFLRGQELFLSVQEQNSWYDEYQRYNFLLSPIPMGSYARRAAVLLGVVALLWFLGLAAAARARDVAVPLPLLLAGSSLAAAFLLLWITPSKWTHHFGALAGLGPVFLGLFLVSLPWLAAQVTRGRRTGAGVPVAVLGSLVLACALALRGPNQWAYSWLPGMPQPMVPPYLGPLTLGSPVLWAVVAVAVLGVLTLVRRRTGGSWARSWVAAPVVALVCLGTGLTYLLGSYAYAAVTTLDDWSPWADALADPLADDCGAAGGMEVLDVGAARPLVPGDDAAATTSTAFVPDGGWFPVDPPPPGTGDVWGTLAPPEGEDATGTLTTPWYPVPDLAGDEALTVLAAGRLDRGNEVSVEYATAGDGGEPVLTGRQQLTDAVDSPVWRTFVLDPGGAGGAPDLVRLAAEDRSGGAGGWLAVTSPSVLPWTPLQDVLPEDEAVATAWQVSFLFPCQRQPVVRLGVTEPVTHGVVWRPGPGAWGLDDNTWQVPRGGLFAPVERTSAVTELATRFPDWPDVRDLQVFRFELPYTPDAYDLRVDRETRLGWQGAPAG
ncbi:arabinosyltransferase domain-containing protein [Geodermatophilus sp. SYSU D00700]